MESQGVQMRSSEISQVLIIQYVVCTLYSHTVYTMRLRRFSWLLIGTPKTFLEYLDQATNCQLQSSRFQMTKADDKIGNLHHLKAKSFKFRYSFVHQFITAGCSTGFLILSIMQSVIYTISSPKLRQMLQSLRLDENCLVSKMELLSLGI